ncbi:hypothetical protein E4K10_49750 [Streptomyces sp. T1317-0309]|nr:hypothetical protein E4K10_49750 [Streptomyces sp. T1317-0309]
MREPALQRSRPCPGGRGGPSHQPGSGQRPPARRTGRHRRGPATRPAHRPARRCGYRTGRPLRAGPAHSRGRRDWYDAFLLDDGDLALVIGDVTGHDIQAASRMSELRNMLRALAVDRPTNYPGRSCAAWTPPRRA